jgi:hypothetical protein
MPQLSCLQRTLCTADQWLGELFGRVLRPWQSPIHPIKQPAPAVLSSSPPLDSYRYPGARPFSSPSRFTSQPLSEPLRRIYARSVCTLAALPLSTTSHALLFFDKAPSLLLSNELVAKDRGEVPSVDA